LEWGKEVLRLSGLDSVPVEATTLREFGAPYRKPAFSALSNEKATRLGVEMRPWQEALAEHLSCSRDESGAAAATPEVNR
jgi:dTDP-4-dehydrorhamnose reductase